MMSNEELIALCDGTSGEEMSVIVPVTDVRRLVADSQALNMLHKPVDRSWPRKHTPECLTHGVPRTREACICGGTLERIRGGNVGNGDIVG